MIRSSKMKMTGAAALAGALTLTGAAAAGMGVGAWLPETRGAHVPAVEPIAAIRATVTIFNNGDVYAVDNQPLVPTAFSTRGTIQIARITTYHWNYGEGTGRPGTIGLLSDTGYWYGPWKASGQPGQGGVPNAYWVVTPNVKLPPGTYRVVDSDPATWSQNAGSGSAGIAIVDAYKR